MTTGSVSTDSASAWERVRDDSDIQFEPLEPTPPPETPEWLKQLGEALADLFEPVALAIAAAWPVLKWVLLGLAIAMLAYLVWRLVSPYFERPAGSDSETPEWQPERREALALLEEADRLAEAGDYAGAVHLLLHRSVGQIAEARPDLVIPSSTARELAGQPSLPGKARSAFGVIATSVERSLFALQALGRDDWQQARCAYADFALERLD
ncbi:hypothetical protein [Parerythrobacter aestuarii]|uniref:hypothetical protein n=1 Tax=Parerythrobacter aestuarii TaxID=3020909 RepID=UPI0024DE6456|nr:hypothetical protein [Parerythrobacter aestuarii]